MATRTYVAIAGVVLAMLAPLALGQGPGPDVPQPGPEPEGVVDLLVLTRGLFVPISTSVTLVGGDGNPDRCVTENGVTTCRAYCFFWNKDGSHDDGSCTDYTDGRLDRVPETKGIFYCSPADCEGKGKATTGTVDLRARRSDGQLSFDWCAHFEAGVLTDLCQSNWYPNSANPYAADNVEAGECLFGCGNPHSLTGTLGGTFTYELD